ncbi:hypothetical protein FN846DRAFT_363692 [Sphaerosporella brunnea]|uniref:Uncharacterized protein n=1 Tax=Sphaerosporella brunnea TaxID=1250544 RepID=A0A5J5EJB4_9PEZI|nr:hypothetical protein FN846DRAFT_363692 [Sphaerosporella brunnea]
MDIVPVRHLRDMQRHGLSRLLEVTQNHQFSATATVIVRLTAHRLALGRREIHQLNTRFNRFGGSDRLSAVKTETLIRRLPETPSAPSPRADSEATSFPGREIGGGPINQSTSQTPIRSVSATLHGQPRFSSQRRKRARSHGRTAKHSDNGRAIQIYFTTSDTAKAMASRSVTCGSTTTEWPWALLTYSRDGCYITRHRRLGPCEADSRPSISSFYWRISVTHSPSTEDVQQPKKAAKRKEQLRP